MISFHSLASSSAGNCYLAKDGDAALLIECGVRLSLIKERLNFGLSAVSGCLVSHEHGDHASALAAVMASGVDCYLSAGTAAALGLAGHHRMHIVAAGRQFKVGPWAVVPFPAGHDADEPLGFLVGGPSGEKLLFATDTAYLANRFRGVTIIAVECNYQLSMLNRNIATGELSENRKARILATHFGLENVLRFLAETDLSICTEIHLLHMSDGNCNEAECVRAVQMATGIPTYAAASAGGVGHGGTV